MSLTDDRSTWIGKPKPLMLDPHAGMARTMDTTRHYTACSTTGEFELAVPGPGRYPVLVFVRNRTWDTGRARGAAVPGVTPAEIVVKESAKEQVFELQVPAASWRKAGVGR